MPLNRREFLRAVSAGGSAIAAGRANAACENIIYTGTAHWRHFSFSPAQTEPLSIVAQLTPQGRCDVGFGPTYGTPTQHSALPAVLRLNESNFFDMMRGDPATGTSGYRCDRRVYANAGTAYSLKLRINRANRTCTGLVAPVGGTYTVIGENYPFRVGASLPSVDCVTTFVDRGEVDLCTPTVELLEDDFSGSDGIITSDRYYDPAAPPLAGRSLSTNPSPLWLVSSGELERDGGWAFSGLPQARPPAAMLRWRSRRMDFGNTRLRFRYRSGKVGEASAQPTDASQAVAVWLRRQSPYNTYLIYLDYNFGTQFLLKRKIYADCNFKSTFNPEKSNSGVYYVIPDDAGNRRISWSSIASRLPDSERVKPRFPNLPQDKTTMCEFSITTGNEGADVRVRLYRAGVLVGSWFDDGLKGICEQDGKTQRTHLATGVYSSVRNWDPAFGKPLTRGGAVGWRSDNQMFWTDRVRVEVL